MNMSDIMLEAFRQEWENLPPKTQQYYIERFREIAGDEPSQEQEQKPLSDDEIYKLLREWSSDVKRTPIDFARAIEQAHGIGVKE